MSPMVEKVAQAITDAFTNGNVQFEDVEEHHRRPYLEAARAAIEAMSDPSPKMCNAACAAMSPGKRPTPNRVSHKAKHAIRYRAMIQAALEEAQ